MSCLWPSIPLFFWLHFSTCFLFCTSQYLFQTPCLNSSGSMLPSHDMATLLSTASFKASFLRCPTCCVPEVNRKDLHPSLTIDPRFCNSALVLFSRVHPSTLRHNSRQMISQSNHNSSSRASSCFVVLLGDARVCSGFLKAIFISPGTDFLCILSCSATLNSYKHIKFISFPSCIRLPYSTLIDWTSESWPHSSSHSSSFCEGFCASMTCFSFSATSLCGCKP